jgi:hypothetical protein
MSRLELVVLLASLLLLAFIVEVVRRRRLSEAYALLWIGVGVGVLLLGVLRPLVDRLSRLVGVRYGANLVFAVALVFLVVVCVNLSMHVSHLEEKVQSLAEEIALLRGPRRASTAQPDGVDVDLADAPAPGMPDEVASPPAHAEPGRRAPADPAEPS